MVTLPMVMVMVMAMERALISNIFKIGGGCDFIGKQGVLIR